MARVTDVPIVFSTAGRQSLIENGVFREVVELPHGTVGVATFSDDDVARVRALYRIHKPLVLSLGFTSSDKGTDVLLDAAPAVSASRNHDVQFLIAGAPRKRQGLFRLMGRRDVKFQQRLESQARETPNVEISFSGFVDDRDVAPLLFTADVVALPYRRITQSGIANLALSSRAVVVSSDLPGLKSSLGDAAEYVDVDSPSALANQIIHLLGDENASIRQQMRTRSGDRAVSDTYAKVAEQILTAGLAYRSAKGHDSVINARLTDLP
jgi:glycosyltransferase involved in cell wall biosynthesis